MKILSKKTEKRTITVAGSAPDIDSDILSEGREELIQYLIDKYGKNNVCQVNTYGEIQVKSGFKELAKLGGLNFKEANYLTSTFPKKVADDIKNKTDFFKYSNETPPLKKYAKENVEVINNTFLIQGAIRNTGKHAAAIIQTPTQDENGNQMEIWDWFPCKMVDGVLMSEWTGAELDKLGFLKNDFLGLSQLDKVKAIIHLIKGNIGNNIELGNVDLEDEKTYLYFQEGYTQDIFQFSSDGMTTMLMDLIPENIEHLIAANALYRPGAMDFAQDYIELRHGKKIPTFVKGTENALKDTYGKMIYQENLMAIAKEYSGMSDTQADDLRKACGKKSAELMAQQKDKFVNGALSLNRDLGEANKLWDAIDKASLYMFNRSHSASYGILGYTTMYLKAHYPVEFYSVALQFANDESKPRIISEMNKLGEAKVMSPSINESGLEFKADYKNKKIYWSLSSVKWVGEKAVEKIINDRNENGHFYSVKDLFDRVDKRTVNKRAIQNLIIVGAFDEVYNIKRESDRMGIIREYYNEVISEPIPKLFDEISDISKDHWWVLKQIELSGLGVIDYKKTLPEQFDKKLLINPIRFSQKEAQGNDIVIGGIILKAVERKSARGVFMTIELDHNSDIINVLIWNESYEGIKNKFRESVGKLLFMNGIVKFDNYKQKNSVQSTKETKIEIV
jgi:DNA polymerase-3 subunit alpha